MICPACNRELPRESTFPPPDDTLLPFFAYGAFKPGELAFHRLRDLVVSQESPRTIQGELRIRDGLPIANPVGNTRLRGALLRFRRGTEDEAYARIAALEPGKQYRWEIALVENTPANYLVGKSPMKGSVSLEAEDWSGKDDPLFTAALDVVDETLAKHSSFEWDLKPLFRLEMAYMLLWSSIERYASLRYDLSDKATSKIMSIAAEPAFQEALRAQVNTKREVFRADDPASKCVLDPSQPTKALAYYYQIRSNLVHRCKGVVRDHEILNQSLHELLAIFRQVLTTAFTSEPQPAPSPQPE